MRQQDVSEKNTEHNPMVMTPLPTFKSEKSSLNPGRNNSFWEIEPPSSGLNKERRIAVSNFVPGDLKELDEKVKSMMEKSQNMIQSGSKRMTAEICKVCGKEGHPQAIRDHIEANHLDGVSLPCNLCEKTFRSRLNLRRHNCRNKSLI